ncbi:essential MCU regulator, mitochondrial-like [Rhynchophorus ferrugineus]|uniref:Essential MCU regulator, mitochondrial n=1 Tax=Rhynchophorus ferrugineus TaxID=354439 RepID=A0A834MPU6_RHYFE|nr:hypothetical protein GWI33_000098 [Rhynchophorus ferrugineus]
MSASRISTFIKRSCFHHKPQNILINYRTATSTKHGVILPEPHSTSFGLVKVVLTVATGLLIGAGISKNIANFLEENDLFVPEDDDDDD